MTYTHMTRFVATAAGLLGSAAFVALASLPGVAQSTTTQESNSETSTYTYPGPSETPSGSPSVPGTSSVDDPGMTQDQPDQEARRDSNSAPQSPTTELYERGRDGIVDPAEIPSGSEQEPYNTDGNTDANSSLPTSPLTVAQASTRGEEVEEGASAVDEGVPGPGETPSGSPSVPGVSEVDDPGLQDETEGNMERPSMPERDAMNSPSQDGPSAVDEGVPGPGETPSGSPSVPGVSVYDDPNEESDPGMMAPGQDSMEDSSQDGPSAVDEGVPGPGETPSGSPSVPGTSGVDDPGMKN